MRSRLGRIGADFHTHLSAKTITLDYAQEKALCTAVLDRLEKDSSNDVQALAVKCLSVLVHVAADVQVITISDRLCQHILSGRAEMRDVYGIGMKTLIAEAQLAHGPAIVDKASIKLLEGMANVEAGVRSCICTTRMWIRQLLLLPRLALSAAVHIDASPSTNAGAR